MPFLNLHARCCRSYPARCPLQYSVVLKSRMSRHLKYMANSPQPAVSECSYLLQHLHVITKKLKSLDSDDTILQQYKSNFWIVEVPQRGFFIVQTCSEWRPGLVLAWTNCPGRAERMQNCCKPRKKCLHYPMANPRNWVSLRKVTIHFTSQYEWGNIDFFRLSQTSIRWC